MILKINNYGGYFLKIAVGITILLFLLFAGNAGASPLPIFLKINGNEQTGGYISSCWKENNESYSICGDSFSIYTAAEPLLTSSPFTAYLRLPIQEPPGELGISTAKVTDKNKLGEGKGTANGGQAWNINEWKEYKVFLGPESDINLSLEPGLYVLNVFARWEGKGDVSYVFLVQIYGQEAGNVDASPPPAILKISGNEQTSGIGSYCWKVGNETSKLCADTFSIITPREPLLTISPFTAHLRLPLLESPQKLRFYMAPVTNSIESYESRNDFFRSWNFDPDKGNWYILPSVRDSDIDLSLEPGLYVLNVAANWNDKGSINYGFLVQVYEPESKITSHATEKAAGFESVLSITIILAVYIAGRKMR